VSAKTAVASGCVSQCSWTEMLRDGILTCVTARHREALTRAKWEEGEKVLDY